MEKPPARNLNTRLLEAAEEALRKGLLPLAIEQWLAALQQSPDNLSIHNNLGNAYRRLGDADQAQQHFYNALRLDPHHAETHNNLGVLFYKQGQWENSIRCFKKALRINPLYAEAHYNLANSYATLNQFDQAITHYQHVLQFVPNHVNAHINLGMIYVSEEAWPKARQHLRQAVHLNPAEALAGLQLGHVLVTLGEVAEAEVVYQQVIAVNPTLAEAHHNLAILYLKQQKQSEALQHFKTALQLNPQDDTAAHMTQALSPSPSTPPSRGPSTANEGYVRALFDQYAPYYNQHMQQTLQYQVPLLLRDVLGQAIATHAKGLHVLDLGCGTGLCGLYCRDLAFTLTGVDLSPKMLAIAKQLGAYDELIEKDAVGYLTASPDQTFDVIVASEVFSYLGDLSPLFEQVVRTLRPHGWFIFTIELATKESKASETPMAADFSLQTSGRFTHTSAYIHQQVSKHPLLSVETELSLKLRQAPNNTVLGELLLIRKAEPDSQTDSHPAE